MKSSFRRELNLHLTVNECLYVSYTWQHMTTVLVLAIQLPVIEYGFLVAAQFLPVAAQFLPVDAAIISLDLTRVRSVMTSEEHTAAIVIASAVHVRRWVASLAHFEKQDWSASWALFLNSGALNYASLVPFHVPFHVPVFRLSRSSCG